jgi:hypothetical protein
VLSRNTAALLAAIFTLAGCSGASGAAPSYASGATLPADVYGVKISASPNPLLFRSVGETRMLTIREDGFTGDFTITVPRDCNRVGFVPAYLTGPVATVAIRSFVAGDCDLTIAGGSKRVVEHVVIR